MLEKFIDEYVAKFPEENCCWFNHKWLNGKEFGELAKNVTEVLKASGFSAGQRLAVLMPNSPVMLAIMYATWKLGGVFCPLNEKTGEISLIKTLSLLKPFAVILSESVKSELEDALKNAGWVCARFNPENLTGNENFKGVTAPVDDYDKTLAVIFSTSGTTGDPKAVPLTHENIFDNIKACMEHVPDLRPGESLLNVLPNFHAFGFTICCVLPFVLGASQVLVANFMPPSNTLKAIEEAKPDVLLLVPTMLGFAASMLERMGKKLSGLILVIAGGDRYNTKMDDRVTATFGIPMIEGYGITECSPVLAVNPTPSVRKLGTVGPALPRFQLKLKSENGEELPIPGEGVLWCKGPSVTTGYYHAPEINKERFIDGWFNTGDYVRIDEDGYITILDRVTDIIIVGGFNVYPQEVEAILSEHPAVNTAVVVGTPNDMSGEVPKAFIIKEKDSEVTERELVNFCKERLSHYKVPRAVEFVESLPISATGKILRRVLRQKEREKN